MNAYMKTVIYHPKLLLQVLVLKVGRCVKHNKKTERDHLLILVDICSIENSKKTISLFLSLCNVPSVTEAFNSKDGMCLCLVCLEINRKRPLQSVVSM